MAELGERATVQGRRGSARSRPIVQMVALICLL